MNRLFDSVAAAFLGLVWCSACTPPAAALKEALRAPMRWGSFEPLRPTTDGLGHADATAVLANAINRNYHYVGLSVARVVLRNLPEVVPGAHVVLGFELRGALGNEHAIRTVMLPVRPAGPNADVSVVPGPKVEAFPYLGQNLRLTIIAKSVPEPEARLIAGRVAGLAGRLDKLDPMADAAVSAWNSLFASIMYGGPPHIGKWSGEFTLHPADTTLDVRPAQRLLAGRLVWLAQPLKSQRLGSAVNGAALLTLLRLVGDRLVWKDTGIDYADTPYVVLDVTRYKRYPGPHSILKQILRLVDNRSEEGDYDAALEQLSNVGAAAADDRILTSFEKSLHLAMAELRKARIEAARAQRRGRLAELSAHHGAQARAIEKIKRTFRALLDPDEARNLERELRVLRRQLGEKETP